MPSVGRSRRSRRNSNQRQGEVTEAPDSVGYLLSHEVNDSFVAVNRLLRNNEEVYWLKNQFVANGKNYPPGVQFISAKSTTLAQLRTIP
jgi:hypothetical protein